MKTKQLLLIFVPAFLIAIITLFVRVVQYRPLDIKVTAEEQAQATTVPLLPEDPILGNKKAPITLIAFEDFSCEGCEAQTKLLDEVVQRFPNKLKIVWKGSPVSKFPYDSRPAHIYSYCMNEQGKFSEWKKLAFTNSRNLSAALLPTLRDQIPINIKKFEACLNSTAPEDYIKKTEEIAQSLNIQSVPTFFVDDKQIQPPQTVEGWITLLQLAR